MRKLAAPIALVIALTGLVSGASAVGARSQVASDELPSALIRVVDSATGLPLGHAETIVTFIEGDPDHPLVIGPVYGDTTNPGGIVLFKGLPAGDYIVSISADGDVQFGDGPHGDRPPRGALIVVAYDRGAGGHGNAPARLAIALEPLPCRDCQ